MSMCVVSLFYGVLQDKTVVTVLCAPSYRCRCGNMGTTMEIDGRINWSFLQFSQHHDKVNQM
jgi:hypothetical protein